MGMGSEFFEVCASDTLGLRKQLEIDKAILGAGIKHTGFRHRPRAEVARDALVKALRLNPAEVMVRGFYLIRQR